MSKYPVVLMFLFCIALLFLPVFSNATEILGPEVRIQDNDIFVSTGLAALDELEVAISSGIEKEIIFTIELFKNWKFWPDEFVVSKKILRTIKYDNLRGQFVASFYDGDSRIVKKYNDFDSMKSMIFSVKNINLANVRELLPGSYYLRVVAESKSREMPPIIGLLMLFIPEVEMSLAKESHSFNIGHLQ
jgi:hypothetical protein